MLLTCSMRCAGSQRALGCTCQQIVDLVRNNFQRKTMTAEHMLNEQVSPCICSAFCCSGDNVYILGQSVNKDKNSVIACLGLKRTCDKVSRDTVPRIVWNDADQTTAALLQQCDKTRL